MLLLASCRAEQPDEGGPIEGSYLEVFGPHAAAVRPAPGETFTDGYEVVKVVNTSALVITRVESTGGEQSLRYEGAMVAGADRRLGAIQMLPDFPPEDPRLGPLLEAEGATLSGAGEAAELGYELLLGYTWIDDQGDMNHPGLCPLPR